MKYCKNCGAQVEDEDMYCGFCGSKLKEDFTQESGNVKQDFDASFDKEFDDEFQTSGYGIREQNNTATNRNVNNKESEIYVENGFNRTTYTINNSENSNGGHKQQMYNRDARSANTFGILALIFGFLGGILGIVFGAIGLNKAKKALALCENDDYDGKPKATNGRVLSIIGIVLGVISIIIWII